MLPAREVFKFKKFRKASEALVQARAILRRNGRWTRNFLAVQVDAEGGLKSCSTKSKHAKAFCSLGVVQFVNGPAQKSAVAFLREAGKKVLVEASRINQEYKPDDRHIFHVNDCEGFDSVLRMFSLAIRAAKKAGK